MLHCAIVLACCCSAANVLPMAIRATIREDHGWAMIGSFLFVANIISAAANLIALID